jgi:hypothetical protein
MPKIYRCNKINELGITCGETEAFRFEDGRYTTCKKCRLRFMSEYNKSKKSNKKEEVVNKIDPDNNIRYVIEDTILRTKILNGASIPSKIEDLEIDISQIAEKNYEIMIQLIEFKEIVSLKMNELKKENDLLKIQVKVLKDIYDPINK